MKTSTQQLIKRFDIENTRFLKIQINNDFLPIKWIEGNQLIKTLKYLRSIDNEYYGSVPRKFAIYAIEKEIKYREAIADKVFSIFSHKNFNEEYFHIINNISNKPKQVITTKGLSAAGIPA